MLKVVVVFIALNIIACNKQSQETQLNSSRNNKGFAIYLAKDIDPNYEDSCTYCFELKLENLSDVPIVKMEDIQYYQWDTHTIFLTDEGFKKYMSLKVPLEGLPIILAINGEIIYGAWIWNVISSHGCDRIYAVQLPPFNNQKVIKLEFGLPEDNRYGEDSRNNAEIRDYFTNEGKLK